MNKIHPLEQWEIDKDLPLEGMDSFIRFTQCTCIIKGFDDAELKFYKSNKTGKLKFQYKGWIEDDMVLREGEHFVYINERLSSEEREKLGRWLLNL